MIVIINKQIEKGVSGYLVRIYAKEASLDRVYYSGDDLYIYKDAGRVFIAKRNEKPVFSSPLLHTIISY